MSWESPIEIIVNQMESAWMDETFRVIQKVGINVDRNELIKALQYDRNQYEKGYEDGKREAAQRWIPVDERLPEVGESVLVTFSLIEKYSWVKIARYGTPLYDEHNVCFYESDSEWGDYEISGVTAWMPLPKPYERRTDETDR